MDQCRASREQTRKGTHNEELNAGATICQIFMILMLGKLFEKKSDYFVDRFCSFEVSTGYLAENNIFFY